MPTLSRRTPPSVRLPTEGFGTNGHKGDHLGTAMWRAAAPSVPSALVVAVAEAEGLTSGRCARCHVPVRDVFAPCWACGVTPPPRVEAVVVAPQLGTLCMAVPADLPWPSGEVPVPVPPRPGIAVGFAASGALGVLSVIGLIVVMLGAGASTSVNARSTDAVAGAAAAAAPAPTTPSPDVVPPTTRQAVATTASPAVTTPARAATSVARPTAADALSVASLDAVFTRLWDQRRQAIAAGDAAALAQIEAAPALDIDRCGCPHAPGPLAKHFIFPVTTGYPASFLGVGLSTADGHALWELLIIRSEAAGRPWRIVHASGYTTAAADGGMALSPMIDATGRYVVPAATSPKAEAGRVLADVAAYLASFKKTGKAPAGSDMMHNGLIDSRAADVATYPEGTVHANGLVGRWTFSLDKSLPVYRFGVEGGLILVCGTLRQTATYTSPVAGAPVVQDPARLLFGSSLAPGAYKAVAVQRLEDVCVETWPDRREGIVVVSSERADVRADPVV
jgi:hypothetical protein